MSESKLRRAILYGGLLTAARCISNVNGQNHLRRINVIRRETGPRKAISTIYDSLFSEDARYLEMMSMSLSPVIPKKFDLEVIRGSGEGSYINKTSVGIVAESGSGFDKWVVISGEPTINDVRNPATELIMPEGDVVVEAVFKKYTLTVENGIGGGLFEEGEDVAIVAFPEEEFAAWQIIGDTCDPIIGSVTSSQTTLKMPNCSVVVRAVYNKYSLVIKEGFGDGAYEAGAIVNIQAQSSREFLKWVTKSGSPNIVEVTSSETIITMPSEDSTIEATYKKYKLLVNNGIGDGDYESGASVRLDSDLPPNGLEFDKWIIETGTPGLDVNEPGPLLIMPSSDVTITATYRNIKFSLEVISGDGDGNYVEGKVIDITAESSLEDQIFKEWSIISGTPTISDISDPNTVLTMPGENVIVGATYEPTFSLTIVSGTGDGKYVVETVVKIIADPPADNKEFDKWVIESGSPAIKNINKRNSELTMSSGDATIRAKYRNIKYTVEVISGDGDGNYIEGKIIEITAESPPKNQIFKEWSIISGNPTINDMSDPNTVLTVPDENVIVSAIYEPTFSLTVVSGTGDGKYVSEAVVTITADPPGTSEEFDKWVVDSGSLTIKNVNKPNTQLTIPSGDVTVTATYKDVLNKCGITDKKRVNQITEILLGVSDPSSFLDLESPQSHAVDWLIEDDFFVCPGDDNKKLIQRYTMAVLYFSTDGDNWKECYRNDPNCGEEDNDFEGGNAYLSSTDECTWAGSTCNDDLCATEIVFEERNQMSGRIPEEIGNLKVLEELSLERQSLTGSIPSSLFDIITLRVIDFDYNELSGSLPVSMYGAIRLEEVDLNNNALTGTISRSIGNLNRLFFLQLHWNNFVGVIPDDIVNTPLVVGEFHGNNFEGEMPLCIGVGSIKALSADCSLPDPKIICGDVCGCNCF